MQPPATPALVKSFATYFRSLLLAVEGLRHGPRIIVTAATIQAALTRVHEINRRFRDLAESIAAGTYRPRARSAEPRKSPATPDPEPPAAPGPGSERKDSLFRPRGWLSPLLPETAAQYRGGLLRLLQDPEMPALVEAAPASMRRTLRPLFWALGFKPPPILALPPRPRKPRPPKVKARRKPKPPRFDPSQLPEWVRTMPPSADWSAPHLDPRRRSRKIG